MFLPAKQKWSTEEEVFLKDNYKGLHIEDLLKELPGRTDDAIHGKAHRMGITGDRYGVSPVRDKPKGQVKGRKRKRKHRRWCDVRYATKRSPTEGKKPIRIDHKTVIYVPIAATEREIELIKNKFQKTSL